MAYKDGLYLQWFGVEWAARISPRRSIDLDAARHAFLTVKDVALALALIGRFSSEVVQYADASEFRRCRQMASLGVATPDMRRHIEVTNATGDSPLLNGVPMPSVKVYDLAREVGLPARRDVERLLGRTRSAMVGLDDEVFNALAVVDRDGTPTVEYALNGTMLRAHPVNSPSRSAIAVDVGALARLRCVQSIPVAMRAMAWLSAKTVTGLGRVSHAFDGAGLHIRLPAARVQAFWGLDPEATFSPASLLVDRIVADLEGLGILSEWEWIMEGRTAVELRTTIQAGRYRANVRKTRTHSDLISRKLARAARDDLRERGLLPKRRSHRRFPVDTIPTAYDVAHPNWREDADANAGPAVLVDATTFAPVRSDATEDEGSHDDWSVDDVDVGEDEYDPNPYVDPNDE